MQKTFGVESAVVGNGVDMRRFAEVRAGRACATGGRVWARAAPVVLAVGGVEERKNTLRILGAFARLRARWPDARLWILGGATVLDHGAYRAAFERARESAAGGDARGGRRAGRRRRADVPALFRLADVLAMPSLHEGFGLAALEALAAGLPLVASARAPFTEYLDATCAVLVDPLSEAASPPACSAALEARPGAARGRAPARRGLFLGARRRAAPSTTTKGPSVMPEMHFRIRWPDGDEMRCYSPSLIVREYLEVGRTYPLHDFLERSRTMLQIGSERVRAKYGFACSAAMDQLATIEERSTGCGDSRAGDGDRVRAAGRGARRRAVSRGWTDSPWLTRRSAPITASW